MIDAPKCRCGHEGDGPHPCHAKSYSCCQFAEQRFYVIPGERYSLTGVQMKVQARETWACDPCWEEYKMLLDKAAKAISSLVE